MINDHANLGFFSVLKLIFFYFYCHFYEYLLTFPVGVVKGLDPDPD